MRGVDVKNRVLISFFGVLRDRLELLRFCVVVNVMSIVRGRQVLGDFFRH